LECSVLDLCRNDSAGFEEPIYNTNCRRSSGVGEEDLLLRAKKIDDSLPY
jgi:hypothetical protein